MDLETDSIKGIHPLETHRWRSSATAYPYSILHARARYSGRVFHALSAACSYPYTYRGQSRQRGRREQQLNSPPITNTKTALTSGPCTDTASALQRIYNLSLVAAPFPPMDRTSKLTRVGTVFG